MDRSHKVGVFGSLGILLGAGVLDWSLTLGQFSGVAFLLYSVYGLGALGVGLLLTAVFRGRQWMFAALWPLGGVALLWLVAAVL